MDNKDKNKTNAEEMFAEWMKSATDFLGGFNQMQSGWPDFFGTGGSTPKGPAYKSKKAWDSGSKYFQSLFSSFSTPENFEGILNNMDSVPDFMTSMTQQTWEGFLELQKQWMDKASKAGQQTKAYNFEDIDQDTFKTIREIYENEFQKFLQIPPLGLTRFKQEKINILIDKYNLFQTALGEFLYLFYVPIEKSSAVMQEKIEEMVEQGEINHDFKDYYNMWVKVLEGHYMTLLQSPEYTKVMDNTIKSLVQYRNAKDDLLCDVVSQQLPVPTNRDMDELYKEIYLLKKKVNKLSRKIEGDQ